MAEKDEVVTGTGSELAVIAMMWTAVLAAKNAGLCLDCLVYTSKPAKHAEENCPLEANLVRAAREVAVQGLDQGSRDGVWASREVAWGTGRDIVVRVSLGDLEKLEAALVATDSLEPWAGKVRR